MEISHDHICHGFLTGTTAAVSLPQYAHPELDLGHA